MSQTYTHTKATISITLSKQYTISRTLKCITIFACVEVSVTYSFLSTVPLNLLASKNTSDESSRDDPGLNWFTWLKNLSKNSVNCSLPLPSHILVKNVPFRCKTCSANWRAVKESCIIDSWSNDLIPDALGAMSLHTRSAFLPSRADRIFPWAWRDVKSVFGIVTAPVTGWKGLRSIDTTSDSDLSHSGNSSPSALQIPSLLVRTCVQEPGAAPNSTATMPGVSILNWSSSSINLNADLALKRSYLAFFTYGSLSWRVSHAAELVDLPLRLLGMVL